MDYERHRGRWLSLWISQAHLSETSNANALSPNAYTPPGSGGSHSYFATAVPVPGTLYAQEGSYRYGYWLTRHDTNNSNLSECQVNDGLDPGYHLYHNEGITSGVDPNAQIESAYLSTGVWNGGSGDYIGETVEQGSLSNVWDSSTNKQSGDASIAFSVYPTSVTWNFPIGTGSDVSISDDSSLNNYAAYQFNYNWTGTLGNSSDPSGQGLWYLQPGASIQNTQGYLYVNTDSKGSFWTDENGSYHSWTTGDMYDTRLFLRLLRF